MAEDTINKLKTALNAKEDIKDAIESQGVPVGDSPFVAYASKIKEIENNIEVVQEEGDSEESVMSQKAATTSLSAIRTNVQSLSDALNSATIAAGSGNKIVVVEALPKNGTDKYIYIVKDADNNYKSYMCTVSGETSTYTPLVSFMNNVEGYKEYPVTQKAVVTKFDSIEGDISDRIKAAIVEYEDIDQVEDSQMLSLGNTLVFDKKTSNLYLITIKQNGSKMSAVKNLIEQDFSKDIHDLFDFKDKADNDISTIGGKVDDVINDLNTETSKFDSFKRGFEDLSNPNSITSGDLKPLADWMTSKTTELSTIGGKVDDNITTTSNLSTTVNNHNTSITTLTSKVDNLESNIGKGGYTVATLNNLGNVDVEDPDETKIYLVSFEAADGGIVYKPYVYQDEVWVSLNGLTKTMYENRKRLPGGADAQNYDLTKYIYNAAETEAAIDKAINESTQYAVLLDDSYETDPYDETLVDENNIRVFIDGYYANIGGTVYKLADRGVDLTSNLTYTNGYMFLNATTKAIQAQDLGDNLGHFSNAVDIQDYDEIEVSGLSDVNDVKFPDAPKGTNPEGSFLSYYVTGTNTNSTKTISTEDLGFHTIINVSDLKALGWKNLKLRVFCRNRNKRVRVVAKTLPNI